MSRMADEENVTLSGKERELVKQAAAQYMENLKNAGDSFEITRDVAESLYEDYWKAEKLVETLTENVNLGFFSKTADQLILHGIFQHAVYHDRKLISQIAAAVLSILQIFS